MTPRTLIPQRGFSLVELMVSVVIGMLAILFATRLIVNGEQSKGAALGSSDSMQNGMLALFSLSDDAAQAGWGLNDTLVSGCNTVMSDTSGYALPAATRGGVAVTPLAAVVIQSNGANPDQISLSSGSSAAAVGSLVLFQAYAGGATLVVPTSAPYGFSVNDVLLVAPQPVSPTGVCNLVQVSGISGANIGIASASTLRFNTGAMGTNYPSNGARIFNLGQPATLSLHTWSLANGVLRLRASNLAGASAQPASVIDNIVSVKAQYGFDTRVTAKPYDPTPAPLGNGMQVTQWSGPMIDADNDLVAGDAGDYQRIVAVRLAVVARSKNPDKPNAAGQCSATTTLPVVFATAAPATVAAAPMSVNVAVANDPISWTCYRYRVFETIVPLRNSQWRPG